MYRGTGGSDGTDVGGRFHRTTNKIIKTLVFKLRERKPALSLAKMCDVI